MYLVYTAVGLLLEYIELDDMTIVTVYVYFYRSTLYLHRPDDKSRALVQCSCIILIDMRFEFIYFAFILNVNLESFTHVITVYSYSYRALLVINDTRCATRELRHA